jgi:YbbR domain-containing protein
MDVRVSLSGTERDFSGETNTMAISLDLEGIRDGMQEFPVNESVILSKPTGTAVSQVEPRVIKLRAYSLVDMELPVKIRFEKSLPPNMRLLGAVAQPGTVKVAVPQERKEEFLSVHTEPINLDEITQSVTLRVKLMLPDQVQMVSGASAMVKVKIDIEDKGRKSK